PDRLGDLRHGQHRGRGAETFEYGCLDLVVGANLLPLQRLERGDRLAAVDGVRAGRVGADDEEVLVSAQLAGADEPRIGESALAQVVEKPGQFEQLVVGEPVWRLPRDDESDIRSAIEDEAR